MSEYETILMNEIKTIDDLYAHACVSCKSEWYCPTHCEWLEKAEKCLLKKYKRHTSEMKVICAKFIDMLRTIK